MNANMRAGNRAGGGGIGDWVYSNEAFVTMIERQGLHRGGAHVLYKSGLVKFMEYPGEFPMTEKFIQALESLDDLKEAR